MATPLILCENSVIARQSNQMQLVNKNQKKIEKTIKKNNKNKK